MLASYRALYDSPDLEAARAHILAAHESGRADALTYVGTLYYEAGLQLTLGEIDEAIATLERVVALSGALDDLVQLGSAQATLAVALARLGRVEEAMRAASAAHAFP